MIFKILFWLLPFLLISCSSVNVEKQPQGIDGLSDDVQKSLYMPNGTEVLMNESVQNNKIYSDANFIIWKKRWEERLKLNNNTAEKFLKLMRSVNPLIIPRNHKVEEALEAADNNDLTLLKKLIKVLETPYEKQQENIDYQSPAPIGDKKYQTFCGT